MKLSDMRGLGWARTVSVLCLPLQREAGRRELSRWLTEMAERPDSASLLPPLEEETRELLTRTLGMDWMDTDLMWLLLTLRRHPAHRVVWVVMTLREVSCRRLTEAVLEDLAREELQRAGDTALLHRLMGGVGQLLSQEEPQPGVLPQPGVASPLLLRREGEHITERLLMRLKEETHE